MTVRAEMWPLVYDYFWFYIDRNRKNKFVEYSDYIEIDDASIWKYSFRLQSHYDANLLDIAIIRSHGTESDYKCDYKNSHDIDVLFSDEELCKKVSIELEKLREVRRSVVLTEEISEKEFHYYYSEIFNPSLTKYLRIVPNQDKIEELIKTLIKYYTNSGYKLNERIFNDTLFVADSDKVNIIVFTDSDAMAAELSFIIMSNDLAEILE